MLNAVQAIDLSDQEPMIALQLCTLLKDTQCRLLVAGGDGTVAWVLNAVQDLKLKVRKTILELFKDSSWILEDTRHFFSIVLSSYCIVPPVFEN